MPSRFLDENVMLAAQEIFIAHDWVYTKGNYQCAESVICSLNEHSLTLNPINTKVYTVMTTLKDKQFDFLSIHKDHQYILLQDLIHNFQVTHGLSMVLGWTWSNMADSDEMEEKLFVAAAHPSNPEVKKDKKKCADMYPDASYPEPSCKIFAWQPREDTMSLDFEHDEL